MTAATITVTDSVALNKSAIETVLAGNINTNSIVVPVIHNNSVIFVIYNNT